MLGKDLPLKTTLESVFFLWLVKTLKNLLTIRIVNQLDKCGLFSDFWNGLRSSRSTIDLLTVVFDKNARNFNRSGTTRAVAHISKAFNKVWHADLLPEIRSHGTLDQVFSFTSSLFSNRQLLVVLDGNSSQEYQTNAGVPQGYILDSTLFLLMTFLMMLSLMLLSMLIILLSALNMIWHINCGNN